MKSFAVPLYLIRQLSDGQFHSGEKLGEQLGMSRAAVNKHMQTLRDWGLDIFTVTRKGYCLAAPLQLLDQERIADLLPEGRVDVLSVIDSTNEYLLKRIEQLSSGDACVAEYQQAGRGRRGRQWFSPFGSNLYLSIFWRFEQGPAAVTGLSLAIGIVITEVLHQLGAVDVRVKWPNDLYIHDRKLAGILVELIGKTGDCANVVIGAGINLAMRGADPNVVNQRWANLQDVAELQLDRNQLASELLHTLRSSLQRFESEGLAPFLPRWQKLDNFINRPVKLIIGDSEVQGISRGINSQGALLLEQDGVITPFIGGDISLRGA